MHLTGNMIPDIASEYARALIYSLALPSNLSCSEEDFDDSEEGGHSRSQLRSQLREYLGATPAILARDLSPCSDLTVHRQRGL